MEKEVVNLKLPFFKVSANDPWRSSDFVKENFPVGCFIVDDDYTYYFVYHDGGGYICDMTLNRNHVQEAIVEDARHDEFMKSFDIMEEIENRLQQLARLAGECKDEVRKSEVRMSEKFDQQYAQLYVEYCVLKEKVSDIPKGGSGVGSILDIAKAAAVIQKPELIDKL